MPRWLAALALLLALAALTTAVPPDAQKGQKSAPNPDADQAAARAQVADGLKATVWAAEPLLANPVAFAFDEQGKCYVAETYRHTDGVTDTRGHMYWLDDDIACRTVEDRLAMYKKHRYPAYEKFGEVLRVVWDGSGNGKADRSEPFAGPFNRPQDGLAAGVLARKGDVYFACIPDLYKLRDTDGDGKADETTSLATGFGVRVQFIGHDLHGLRMGPDGKLYFSIGDRGLNVTTRDGKKLVNTDSGAVLRCDPDGSNMEVVHVGLRNPQELAFDDHGNLFTYDNNSDSGDRARWVQIVEGGDSGWRCGYQYGTLMHHAGVPQGNRGPWNTEKIWYVPGPDGDPPAYVVPPLRHIGNGPSGITHYPGVGLGDKYKDHFFACDFTATPGNSVIWAVSLAPKGASFTVAEPKPFVRNMVPTDCEFGPDGAFYWTDWTGGWNKPGKGRIFRVADPEAMKNPAVAEARTLLAEGLGKRSVEELSKLLGHPHQQVRLEAQYELAGRNPAEAIPAFGRVAKGSKDQPARLHAIWGLGMTGRVEANRSLAPLAELAGDPDAEVRASVARAIGAIAQANGPGDRGLNRDTTRALILKLMDDPDVRVRAFAAIAYGKFGPSLPVRFPGSEQAQVTPLFDLLKANGDKDAYLRHAAVIGLTKSVENPCDLLSAWQQGKGKYDTPAVRLGLVLALRKLQCRRLGEFLSDSEPRVVAEAARAIYDQELMAPMPELAKLAEKLGLADPVAYRALAANYKLGEAEHAARVAGYAARESEPDYLREFALKLLADWSKPKRLDPITGQRQELPERPAEVVVGAVRPVLPKLFVGSDAVRKEAVQTTAKLGIKEVGPLMAGLVADARQPAGVRVEALYALEAVKGKELAGAVKVAIESSEPKLRAAGRVVRAKADPAAAAKELPALLNDEKTSNEEKQAALAALGTLRESKEADEALSAWLDKYAAGQVPDVLKLDVLEAVQTRTTTRKLTLHAPLREKLRAIDQAARSASEKDPLARYREALAGGDADKGRQIFLTSAAVYCQRCHQLDGQGGEVGPPLNGVGAKQTREYLLESIVYPSAKIAEGYQSVILNLLDGKTVTGVLRGKTAKEYTIVTADNKVVRVPADDVDSVKPDKSAMPEDLIKKLSKRELRDVVEFLASLKDQPKK